VAQAETWVGQHVMAVGPVLGSSQGLPYTFFDALCASHAVGSHNAGYIEGTARPPGHCSLMPLLVSFLSWKCFIQC
jgi:hypothetical protein